MLLQFHRLGYTPLTGTGENGCNSIAQIEVGLIDDMPQILGFDDSRLDCSNAVILNSIDIASGTPPYQILIDGTSYLYSSLPLEIEGAGIHNLEVRDENDCVDNTELEIESIELLNLDIDPNITIQEGQSIQLELNIEPDLLLVQNIQWQPGTYLSCDDCQNPLARPLEDIGYEAIVLDIYGCESRANVIIDVLRVHKIYIPNVFSLNDFRNNKFRIYFGEGDVEHVNFLRIYDRWGNLVFNEEEFDPVHEDIFWDGHFNDKPVLPGVYVYMTELLLEDGETELFIGDITLLR